ncbi:MAG: MucR family transcriptional regulator [Parvibaculaceae bacterium]|nr:MucR family transcriptional regulator [Parvibaculaceae bacterium]
MAQDDQLIDITAEIVSAYVGQNNIPPNDVPHLIEQVYMALQGVVSGEIRHDEPKPEPAVPPRRSVTPDYIVCLEDGKKFKSLKRHLRTHYDLSPEEYRSKWGLQSDYPMVAPNYAEARSRLAKKMGLGQKGRRGRRPAKAAG